MRVHILLVIAFAILAVDATKRHNTYYRHFAEAAAAKAGASASTSANAGASTDAGAKAAAGAKTAAAAGAKTAAAGAAQAAAGAKEAAAGAAKAAAATGAQAATGAKTAASTGASTGAAAGGKAATGAQGAASTGASANASAGASANTSGGAPSGADITDRPVPNALNCKIEGLTVDNFVYDNFYLGYARGLVWGFATGTLDDAADYPSHEFFKVDAHIHEKYPIYERGAFFGYVQGFQNAYYYGCANYDGTWSNVYCDLFYENLVMNLAVIEGNYERVSGVDIADQCFDEESQETGACKLFAAGIGKAQDAQFTCDDVQIYVDAQESVDQKAFNEHFSVGI